MFFLKMSNNFPTTVQLINNKIILNQQTFSQFKRSFCSFGSLNMPETIQTEFKTKEIPLNEKIAQKSQ